MSPVRYFMDNNNFENRRNCVQKIRNDWTALREALKSKQLYYYETEKALQYSFLKVFDSHLELSGCQREVNMTFMQLRNFTLGRAAILRSGETATLNRFIPDKQYINSPNRFSPEGIEWLYLAIGTDEAAVVETTKAEIRAAAGDRFSYCPFKLSDSINYRKVIDLTVADNSTYEQLDELVDTTTHELFVSATVAEALDQKAQYIKNKGFDDQYYKQLIVDYLNKWGKGRKNDFEKLLFDKLPDSLTAEQKNTKIRNLLSSLRIHGVIETDSENHQRSNWVLTKNRV